MTAAGTPDAQQLYRRLMTGILAPALRELGMEGPARMLRLVNGSYRAGLWPQKNRQYTKEEAEFWFHMGAFYQPAGGEEAGYWHYLLHWLDHRLPKRWTIEAGKPVEPVAEDIVTVMRRHGLPAMLAAIDSPGFPPDPGARWARTFPAAEPDRHFMGISHTMGERARQDTRVRAGLLDRLEHDPSPIVRRTAALELRWSAGELLVGQALRAAATDDEDLDVRWAARYILRLAEPAQRVAG